MSATPQIERHPLKPFLPADAQLLMLGSFPPPKERWCMDFFYPNPQNDMWQIMGHIFYGDKTHFEAPSTKAEKRVFNRDEIVSFCRAKGIAIFDTAQAVIRLQGNAADEHLEIVEPTDIAALLQPIPLCHDMPDELSVSGECLPPHALIRFPLIRKPPHTGRCSKQSACYENLYSYIYLAFWTYRHRKR